MTTLPYFQKEISTTGPPYRLLGRPDNPRGNVRQTATSFVIAYYHSSKHMIYLYQRIGFIIFITTSGEYDTMRSHHPALEIIRLIEILLLTLFCCSIFSTAHADFQKTKIAVLDFEVIGDKLETTDMGAILSEWFITSIVKSGRFDVVERAMLQKIISEQKLSSTGLIDEDSATKLGKLLGVKVIISGSVLKMQDSIEINSRVISVESGSIIAADNIRGSASNDLHLLVDELTAKILRNFPLTGYVVKKNPKSVIIDLGLDSGLASGTEFIVYREGEVIKHPKTGEVLDVEQIITGRMRIDKISKNVAEGDIISEEPGGIQYGHLVKSVQKEIKKPVLPPETKKTVTSITVPPPAPALQPAPAPAPTITQPVQDIKPEKKKVLAAPTVSSPKEEPLPTPSQEPPQPPAPLERPKDYKVAIFPWELFHDAEGFAGILVEKIEYRIKEIPTLILAKSYYQIKRVERFGNIKSRELFNQSVPNLPLLRQKGEELGINVAVLGKLNIYCRWSDNCQVRNIDFTIVDLTSGKIYQESGVSWDMDARDYIELITSKAFNKFAADIRQ